MTTQGNCKVTNKSATLLITQKIRRRLCSGFCRAH